MEIRDTIYKAPILGSFNATNLTVAIKIAKLFGMMMMRFKRD